MIVGTLQQGIFTMPGRTVLSVTYPSSARRTILQARRRSALPRHPAARTEKRKSGIAQQVTSLPPLPHHTSAARGVPHASFPAVSKTMTIITKPHSETVRMPAPGSETSATRNPKLPTTTASNVK